MNKLLPIALLATFGVNAQLSYPPAAGQEGSTAIAKESSIFTGWATGVTVERGYIQIDDTSITYDGSNKATYGTPDDATGLPEQGAISLGDGGIATATFAAPIANGPGFDFAVFENGLSDTFLELAFVEVSSDGVHFFRFPAVSQTQTDTPVGGFGTLDARNLNNLAGKYRNGFGTPFDLSELPDDELLNKNSITHIRVIDVVGTLDPAYSRYDSLGNKINDLYPTPYNTGGFDLTGIGIINQGSLSSNEEELLLFTMYPNPALDEVTITTGNQGIANVTIYDFSGRTVLNLQLDDSGTINIANLVPGPYLLLVSVNDKISVKQLVKK